MLTNVDLIVFKRLLLALHIDPIYWVVGAWKAPTNETQERENQRHPLWVNDRKSVGAPERDGRPRRSVVVDWEVWMVIGGRQLNR